MPLNHFIANQKTAAGIVMKIVSIHDEMALTPKESVGLDLFVVVLFNIDRPNVMISPQDIFHCQHRGQH